jgi:hypothetical protein
MEETITILKVGTQEAVQNIADLRENVKTLKENLKNLESQTGDSEEKMEGIPGHTRCAQDQPGSLEGCDVCNHRDI